MVKAMGLNIIENGKDLKFGVCEGRKKLQRKSEKCGRNQKTIANAAGREMRLRLNLILKTLSVLLICGRVHFETCAF